MAEKLDQELLRYIVCPECKGNLQVQVTGPGDIEIGELIKCENGHGFIVNNGVPNMLMDMDDRQKLTADSFSNKWSSVPDYGHEEGTREFHKKWYLERYGWPSEVELGEVLIDANCILDAGAGIGRDVAWYAGLTAVSPVVGVDIGDGIYIAREKINDPNVFLVKADIMNLPFREEQFDFIASDFVLHHTPDTKEALKKLVGLLRPGGMISFYVYAKKSEVREKVDDLLREITTKMTHEECMKFSEALTLFGKSLTEINVEFQRKIYWEIMKCFWNPDFTLAHNISVNYDWYRPVYAWRHTPGEVKGWCESMGLHSLHIDVQESGISYRGVKKATGRSIKTPRKGGTVSRSEVRKAVQKSPPERKRR